MRENEERAQGCSTDAVTGSKEVLMLKMFVIQALAAGIAVLIAAKIMPGVRIRKTETAIGIALAFALLNLVAGWLLKLVLAIVLLPAAVLTFGLAYLVLGLIVNMILLYITDKLIDDFEVNGLWPLAGAAGLISIAAWLLPRIF
jgi:putative membrane protein